MWEISQEVWVVGVKLGLEDRVRFQEDADVGGSSKHLRPKVFLEMC